MNRKTIKKQFTFNGIGLHTGKEAIVTVKPMEENHGIVFIKKTGGLDIELKADVKNVTTTIRSTTIGKDGHDIKTIEHLLAAVYALGIDDLYIEVEGEEIPILDGSSKFHCENLNNAEIVEKDGEKEFFVVDDLFEFKFPETGSEYIALPCDRFEVSALIDFKSPVVSKQFAEIREIETFCSEFAECRTFGFFTEIESLLDQGLIKGGSLDNAIVIADKEITKEDIKRFEKKVNLEKINVKDKGILSAKPLKFGNEPARHKLLDFIGDISLLGLPIKGRFIIKRPGHRANVEFGKFLRQQVMRQKRLKGKPIYDPNATPVLDTKDIIELLPHRYPFLLVDKIIELTDTYVVGVKNLTFNEMLFQGHFPNNPIFPGVLQMEALAQTGGILALKIQNLNEKCDTYFLKMDNVKFKSMAVPGDTLIMKMELLEPIRRGIVHMKGTIYVGDRIVSEGELTAQVVISNNGK